jgi:hypothetical protein
MTADSPNYFVKDPNATLDYSVDWTDWLDTDTISGVAWTVPAGITQTAVAATTKVATIWLSGGTAGQSYDLICRITTAGGRIDDRTISIMVREK